MIKTIVNLYKYDSGNVKICEYDTKIELENALSKIGCMVENPNLYENLTGRKNLRIIELINGIKDKEYTDKMI